MFDCEALRGRKATFEDKDHYTLDKTTITSGIHLASVFWGYDMYGITGHQLGYGTGTLSARISFSLPNDQLFQFFDTMQRIRKDFFEPGLTHQPDLFRHYARTLNL